VPMSKHRYDHTVDHMHESKPNRLQRVEVITSVERRRTWLPEEKLAIVAESCADGVTVSEVARRHGISPQQLFGWRSQLRAATPAMAQIEPPPFVAAIVDGATARPVAMELASRGPDDSASIVVIIGPAIVRVRGAVDLRALTTVLKALKVPL
jgi:transposase